MISSRTKHFRIVLTVVFEHTITSNIELNRVKRFTPICLEMDWMFKHQRTQFLSFTVKMKAMIRNQYNQVQHLAQDTICKSDKKENITPNRASCQPFTSR